MNDFKKNSQDTIVNKKKIGAVYNIVPVGFGACVKRGPGVAGKQ